MPETPDSIPDAELDLAIRAQRSVRPALPVIHAAAQRRLGDGWLEAVNRRRSERGKPSTGPADVRGMLAVVAHEDDVAAEFDPPVRTIAKRLNTILNIASHETSEQWRSGDGETAVKLADELLRRLGVGEPEAKREPELELGAFDKKRYNRDVLRPAHERDEVPELFALYALDPASVAKLTESDHRRLLDHIEAVAELWRQQRNHPTFGPLCERLVRTHSKHAIAFGDLAGTKRKAQAALRERAGRQSTALEQLDVLVKKAIAEVGGLRTSAYEKLLAWALAKGVDEAAARQRLDAAPRATEPELGTISAAKLDALNAQLRTLARVTRNPALGLSAFHALGLTADATPEQLARACEHAERQIAGRAYRDPEHVAVDSIISFARTELVQKGPAAYLATLREQVIAALSGEALAMLLDQKVDANEFAQLKRAAMDLGLTEADAHAAVFQLAVEARATIETGTEERSVVCPSCNKHHSADAAPPHCSQCGTALFADCPACGARGPARDKACGRCGFNRGRAAEAAVLVDRARRALDEGRPADALATAKGAAELAPREARADQVLEAARAALSRAEQAWEACERAIAERRIFAARTLLLDLVAQASDVAGPGDTVPTERLEAIAARVETAERRLQEARTTAGRAARERAFVAVLELAADAPEAVAELRATPPTPVRNVEVELGAGTAHVTWTPSSAPGRIEYAVTRSVAGRGREELARTTGRTCDDAGVRPGAIVVYEVVAQRAGAASSPARSAPTVAAFEVSDLVAVEGDGEVALQWRAIGTGGSVRVERRDLGDGVVTRRAAAVSGLRDDDVVNGRRYRYRVSVEYPNGRGGTLKTAGVEVVATPQARPEPIGDLTVEVRDGAAELSWTPPLHGTVVLVRCAERPPLREGDELTPERAVAVGHEVPSAAGRAIDRHAAAAVSWYTPFTVAGNRAVAGRPLRHVALPPITAVRAADVRPAALVIWTWPERVDQAVVVWSGDRVPRHPDADGAQRRRVTAADYRSEGGIRIPWTTGAAMHVAVFPVVELEGEVIAGTTVGPTSMASLQRAERTPVHFAVRGGRRRVEFKARIDDGPLPSLIVVARRGEILPQSPDQGRVVAQLGGTPDGPSSASCKVEVSELGRPAALFPFLATPEGSQGFRILVTDTRDLVVR